MGYVNIDQKGQSGLERYFENNLSISKNIYSTIDINLQQAVRKNLMDTINFYKAESGLAIVMQIDTGQIISSVSLPDYNPEMKSTFNDNNLINRVFQSNFEMGSTFKPITAIMGYDLGILDLNMKFDVTKKYLNISDHDKFKDDGIYDIEKIIVESSNIGTAQLATKIGKQNQINFFNKIGFYDRIEFENKEAVYPLGNKNNWGPLRNSNYWFWSWVFITPLHLVKAYATLSNNGIVVNPTLKLKEKILKKNKY